MRGGAALTAQFARSGTSGSGGMAWLNPLKPAVFATAAVMIVAGIYLLDPRVIDLGFALNAERTGLVGVFLIVAGSALVFKLAWPNGLSSGSVTADLLITFLLGQMALLALGFIQVAIGGQALFATPLNFWAAALIVPGLLCLALGFSEEGDAKEGPDSEEGANATEPESGQVDLGATTRFNLVYGAIYGAYMFAFFIWIAVGFWLYYSLESVILDGATLDASTAVTSLWTAVVKSLPTALPLAIVVTVIIVAAGFIGVLFQWLSQGGAPDANRDLSAAEVAFIDTSAETVTAYAKAQGYDRNVWVMQVFGLVAVLAAIGVGAIAMFAVIATQETVPANSSFPIELKPGGASAIIGFFAFIMLGVVPNSILSRLSQRYSERAGWVAIGIEKEYFSLTGKLTAFVRARRFSIATPINPGEFLHAANLSVERYFYVPAAVVALIALFLYHRDRNAVDILMADAIEIADYWTLARERYGYGDVERVKVRCFLTDKGETVEYYELHLRGGRTLDIYKEENVAAQLEAYLTVDAKLIALGVPFVPGGHGGWFKSDERGYDADCVEKVAESFSEELRPKVRRLFHLDEFRAVEDIWPWDAELAQGRTAGARYEVERAVALYTKAIASGRLTEHLLAVAYRGRGHARDNYEYAHGMRDGEMLLALRDYQKAREIEPTLDIYRDEAWALAALGAYDDATAAYRKALELDKPKPHWSLIGLARVERIQGRYDAAMRYLDQVLQVWGEGNASMPIYYNQAHALFLKNDNAGVVDAITKGLAYQTDHSDAFRFRACAHARLGEFVKAKADIAQAIKLAHAPPIDEAWAKTPLAKAFYAEYERDRAMIDAMAAGTASDADRATLCTDIWNYGLALRTRSSLLPPGR